MSRLGISISGRWTTSRSIVCEPKSGHLIDLDADSLATGQGGEQPDGCLQPDQGTEREIGMDKLYDRMFAEKVTEHLRPLWNLIKGVRHDALYPTVPK